MKKSTLFLLGLLISTFSFSQVLEENLWKNYKPRSIGPAGMSGRVTTIDVLNNQPNTIYVGTASGGLWRSENGGINWQPLFDEQPVASIGAVAIQQNNPDVIWAGTGEGNPRNSHTSGYGIYKTIDGGKTWKCLGLEETRNIHRIIIHRDDPNTVFIAATGSAWGPTKARGVFKTTDGGKSWEKVLFVNDTTGCADLIVDPSNPNKLFAAMWQHQRWPWYFESGGKGSGLYVSHDAGKNWKLLSKKEGLPDGKLGRIGLGISAANPNRVYALVESKKTSLFRSDDGGESFKQIADKNIGNRPFYYADIYVDPKNENRIYNLYSLVTKSEDGGKTFEVIMPYSGYHPDHHAFYIHPEDNKYLINGNDGGLNISRDGGETWRFVENLPLAQFYHINVDNDIPYNVYGGMQDNGSWVGPAYVWQSSGIRNTDWTELYFGDGFDVVPDPDNNRYVYAMYQGGNVARIDKTTGQNHSIKPLHPEGEELRFHWNAAIAQDPFNSKGLYFGSQYVHKSEDQGNSWEIISPDLTTNNPEKQKQAESGGLTIDATKAENHTTIIAIEPSTLNKEVIWVGTDDGNIQLTKDGGTTWTNLSPKIKGLPKEAWVPQIRASKYNVGEAFVVVNNYRQNDWKPYLYYTTDFGASWKNLVNENEVDGHCLSIIQDPVEENLLFLGTERGLYITFDKGQNWQKWKFGFPSVPTRDLQIQEREADLVIGTFGRAAYVLDDIRPLRAVAKVGIENFNDLNVFDIPDAYLAYTAQPKGIRFEADAIFNGDNRRRGAMISIWWSGSQAKAEQADKDEENEEKETPKKSASKKESKSTVVIYNLEGDTVRNFKTKLDSGFNRITWNMRENGVRYPSYNEPKKDANPPQGRWAKPGEYKVVIALGELKDSATVTLKSDPRLNINLDDLKAKDEYGDKLENLIVVGAEITSQLNDITKRINKINGTLDLLPDSIQKKIKKEGKAVSDSMKTIYELFMLDKNFEGYDHVTVRINDLYGSANEYIMGPTGKPGPQADLALAKIEKELGAALNQFNTFLENTWLPYRKLVEESSVKLFKDYEKLELNNE